MAHSETLRGTWVVAYRELLRYVTERSRIVSSLAMPLLLLIVFGAGFTNVIGGMAPGIDYLQFMYPGIIAITVLTTSLFAGISVVWDREYGFLRRSWWHPSHARASSWARPSGPPSRRPSRWP